MPIESRYNCDEHVQVVVESTTTNLLKQETKNLDVRMRNLSEESEIEITEKGGVEFAVALISAVLIYAVDKEEVLRFIFRRCAPNCM